MQIYCKTCNSLATKPLKQLTDLSLLSDIWEYNTDFLPQGYYFTGKQIADHPFKKDCFVPIQDEDIIVNIHDIVNLKDHFDEKRLIGCCGYPGDSGYNQLCENGHEIGTHMSDCWVVHAMIFDGKLIRVIK